MHSARNECLLPSVGEYPASFSEGMKAHCRRGCIPPSVFHDLAEFASVERVMAVSQTERSAMKGCQSRVAPPTNTEEDLMRGRDRDQNVSGSRQSAALARYLRLHPHAMQTLIEMGLVLLERELLSLIQERYTASAAIFSAPSTTPSHETAPNSLSHSDSINSTSSSSTAAPLVASDPSCSSSTSLALHFHHAVLSSIASELYGSPDGECDVAQRHTTLDKGGGNSGDSFSPVATDITLPNSRVFTADKVRRDCFHQIPAMLILWFALSHLLRLPLVYLTPVLWLLPDDPTTANDESNDEDDSDNGVHLSMSSSSAALLASPTWMSTHYFMFAFSPLVSVPVRGSVDGPLLGSECTCRRCCYYTEARGLGVPFSCASSCPQQQEEQDASEVELDSPCADSDSKGLVENTGEDTALCGAGSCLRRFSHLKSVPLTFFFTPMDAASLATVVALQPAPGEHILDVCCSPGMKLQALAEKVQAKGSSMPARVNHNHTPKIIATTTTTCGGREESSERKSYMSTAAHNNIKNNNNNNAVRGKEGLVLGVDIDLPRLSVTRSLLQQYTNPFGHHKFVCFSSFPQRGGHVVSEPWYHHPLPVALFHADGTQITWTDAVRSITPREGYVTRRGDHRSAPATLTVSSLTGLTAKEAHALKKKHVQLARDKSNVTVPPSGRASLQHTKVGTPSSSSAVTSQSPSVPLPVYVPTPVRTSLLAAVPHAKVCFAPKRDRSPTQKGSENNEAGDEMSCSTASVQPEKEEENACHGDGLQAGGALFDAALVDVECTHDGSLAHLSLSTGKPSPSSSTSGHEHSASVSEAECSCSTEGGQRRDPSAARTNAYRMAHLHLPKEDAAALPTPRSVGPSQPCGDTTPAQEDEECRNSPLLRQWPCLRGVVWGPPEDPFFLWLRESSLLQLQLALLLHSFEQIREGGRLVYSTCSMSYQQNEYVVQCFLRLVNGNAEKHRLQYEKWPSATKTPEAFVLFPDFAARLVCPFGNCVCPPLALHESDGKRAVPSDHHVAVERHIDGEVFRPPLTQRSPFSASPLPGQARGKRPCNLLSPLCRIQDELLEDPYYSKALGSTFSRSFVPRSVTSRQDFLRALERSLDLYGIVSEGKRRLASLMGQRHQDRHEIPQDEQTPPVEKRFRREANNNNNGEEEDDDIAIGYSECKHQNGVRLWPMVLKTSFQFLIKMEKVYRQGK